MNIKEKITHFLENGTSAWTGVKNVRFPIRGNIVFLELLERYKEKLNYDGIQTFFEAGSYNGNNAADFANVFNNVISIEIDENMYNECIENHGDKKNIKFIRGDASENLLSVLRESPDERMVILLDDHTRYDSFIKEELEAIQHNTNVDHIIIIDDINNLGTGTYPTVETIEKLVKECDKSYQIICSDNKYLIYSEEQ